MEERDDYIGDFCRGQRRGYSVHQVHPQCQRQHRQDLVYLEAGPKRFVHHAGHHADKLYLDELHVKVDNVNKRYFLTSFYYKQRRGNIEGHVLFCVGQAHPHRGHGETPWSLGDAIARKRVGEANSKWHSMTILSATFL
jgi:hypothetical protein